MAMLDCVIDVYDIGVSDQRWKFNGVGVVKF
jgi:hypothetical protein